MASEHGSGIVTVGGRVLDGAFGLLLLAIVWILMLIPMSIAVGVSWIGAGLSGSGARG